MSGPARASGTLLILGFLVMVPSMMVGGLWWRATAEERQRLALQEELREQKENFQKELGRLLGETRRAEFTVIESEEKDGVIHNKIKFVEFLNEDDATSASLEKIIEMPGREFYIDAVLVRFEDDAVREGRARNFAVFRRAFTNRVAPEDGTLLYDVPLEAARERAAQTVKMENPTDSEAFVERLTQYLANPSQASADGVRMVEGEAKYVIPKLGYFYEVHQRASGGLLIEEHKIPAVLAGHK